MVGFSVIYLCICNKYNKQHITHKLFAIQISDKYNTVIALKITCHAFNKRIIVKNIMQLLYRDWIFYLSH